MKAEIGRFSRVVLLLATLFVVLSLSHWRSASAATLLPNGEQTFLDLNGQPLAAGTVGFYVPNTTNFKDTWGDPAQANKNLNPVPLDMAGRAIIYGSGLYRQIVKDVNGNVIWDQLTGDATGSGQLSWGGRSSGSGSAYAINASNFNYLDGQAISFIAAVPNVGPASLAVNGGTPTAIYKDSGNGAVPLSGKPPEILGGNSVTVIYDATNNIFHLAAFPNNVYAVTKNIPAGPTTDLGSLGTNYVNISGTSTITSFGSSASLSQPVYFFSNAGGSTLVNSSQLRLPGGANITGFANDTGLAYYLGGGNWQVAAYFRGSGVATVVTPIPVFGGSGPSHSSGLVPDPGSTPGILHYLREDGNWASPRGAEFWAAGIVTPPTSITVGNNLASIVRNSIGNYTVQFINTLPNANYVVMITPGSSTGTPTLYSVFNQTGSGFTFFAVNSTTGAGIDVTGQVHVAVFTLQ